MKATPPENVGPLPENYQQLVNSPYVQDTLKTILNNELPPVFYKTKPPINAPRAQAYAVPTKDKRTIINVLPRAQDKYADPRHIITHEMGHAKDTQGLVSVGEMLFKGKSAVGDPEFTSNFNTFKRTKPLEYGATNPKEYSAELFTAAISYLQKHLQATEDNTSEIQKELDWLSDYYPGILYRINKIATDNPELYNGNIAATLAKTKYATKQIKDAQSK